MGTGHRDPRLRLGHRRPHLAATVGGVHPV